MTFTKSCILVFERRIRRAAIRDSVSGRDSGDYKIILKLPPAPGYGCSRQKPSKISKNAAHATKLREILTKTPPNVTECSRTEVHGLVCRALFH